MNAIDAWRAIPETRRGELARYLVHGIRPGNTLSLFLSGDVFAASTYADDATLRAMGPIARFCAGFAPTGAYGLPGTIDTWLGVSQAVRESTLLMRLGCAGTFDEMREDSGIVEEVA